jgi:hypothetical protein
VGCGTRDCGTVCAVLYGGHPSAPPGFHTHAIEWAEGLRRGDDGAWALRPAVQRDWDRARRRGQSWQEFARGPAVKARRPHRPSRPDTSPRRQEQPLVRDIPAIRPIPDPSPGTKLERGGWPVQGTDDGQLTFTCPCCRESSFLYFMRIAITDEPCSTCRHGHEPFSRARP